MSWILFSRTLEQIKMHQNIACNGLSVLPCVRIA